MLAKLKLVSNFLIECFMFGCAGLIGMLFLPLVIGAAWLELFKEMKNEFKNLGRPVSDASTAEGLGSEEVEQSEEV